MASGIASRSKLTDHHIVPTGLSKKKLGRPIGYTVDMCEDHHRIFNELVSPYEILYKSKLESDALWVWLVEERVPRIIEKLKELVDVI